MNLKVVYIKNTSTQHKSQIDHVLHRHYNIKNKKRRENSRRFNSLAHIGLLTPFGSLSLVGLLL
jgi:hypothetical protein